MRSRCCNVLVAVLISVFLTLQAQDSPHAKARPTGHDINRRWVAERNQVIRKQHAGDTNILVLPGLVADRRAQRVEVMVERSAVGPNAPCEFLVVSESSDHGYESLLIAFARPSDVHQALQFIGAEPGQSFQPSSQRFWAKGERFILSVVSSNTPSIRVESLLLDRRTDSAFPEEGFLFTGSRRVSSTDTSTEQVYVADAFQPMAIVSLFSSPHAVFDVPRSVSKEYVYRNTTVNPEPPIAEGALLTLAIEPAHPRGSSWVKDLVLEVDSGTTVAGVSGSPVDALANLRLRLKDGSTVLNRDDTLVSVISSMASLDRRKHSHFLALRWSGDVTLGAARALAGILSTVDREQGVRIDPPAPGDLYYRAFTPDRALLDRTERTFHPFELELTKLKSRITGRLLLTESIWKEGTSRSELRFLESPVLNPMELRRELVADQERSRSSGKSPRPAVMLVFAPADLTLAQLTAFLEPVLTERTAIHLFVGESAPSNSRNTPPP